MGRQKKPTNLKILQGTARKHRMNKKEPKPEILIPDPPLTLSGYALTEWKRITPILERLGIISEVDSAGLALYCLAFQKLRLAEEEIEKSGLVIETKQGNLIQSPYVGIANRASLLVHKYLIQFGMTPSSRSSVTTTKANEPHKLAKFLNR